MDSFEQWRARDEQWREENPDLLKEVFQWFLTHGEWPDVAPFQHSLFQKGDRATKVQSVANARPAIPGHFAPGMLPSIWLGARHLLQMKDADTLLKLTVKATKAAVDAFLSAPVPGKPVSLRSAAVGASTPEQLSTLPLIPNFVGGDQPAPLVGGGTVNDWVMGVNEPVVMEFERVESSEDYVARQLRIIKGWCAEYDARRGAIERGGPYRAFIVMPFEEPWSETSRAFLDAVLDSLKGEEEIEAVRADDVDAPGRITLQIIDLLESCDFIIADITGNNANVGWELGFAYSRSKPCAIVRCGDYTESAPFDIYDHRRTDYSGDPTLSQAERLKRMVKAAIEQVRNSQTVNFGEAHGLYGS